MAYHNNVNRKIQCSHCLKNIDISNYNGACDCLKVRVSNGVVIEGVEGRDWTDKSTMLLTE